jgi:hypothetical protein
MPIYTHNDQKNTENGSSSTSTHERTRASKPKSNKLMVISIGVVAILLLVIIGQNIYMNKTFKQEIVSDLPLLENQNPTVANNVQVPSKQNTPTKPASTMTTYKKPVAPSTSYVQPKAIPAQAIPEGYSQITTTSVTETGTVTQNAVIARTVYVPAGARLDTNLETTLSSAVSMVGDSVRASLSSPVVVASGIIIPTGGVLTGSVITSVPARRFKIGNPGSLGIRFTNIKTPNGNYPIGATYNIKGASGAERVAKGLGQTAIGAGTGAALGTAVGAIAGGMPGRGAWSGAAIGGGIGAAAALLSKGDEAILNSGTKLILINE